MKDSGELKILKLGLSKKYDKSGSGKVVKEGGYSNSNSRCDDWCEISIATVKPYISNIYFSHRGCLLSRACMNAIIASIENKTKDEALKILFDFKRMLSLSIIPPQLPESLRLFFKYSKFPSRKPCMLLGCDLIIKELSAYNEEQ